MLRYVAFVWNAADKAQTQTVDDLGSKLASTWERWQCVLNQRGVRVYFWCEDKHGFERNVHALDGNHGVVLGTLFQNAGMGACSHRPACRLDREASERIVTSKGRLLTQAYWGDYVAVLCNPTCDHVSVLRGPASSLPCLRTVNRQVQIFFSFMQDARDLQLSFSIDWEYVAMHLVANVPSDRTAVREVSQLQCGMCLEFTGSAILAHCFWDPLEIARTEIIEDSALAAELLRTTVRACVHAWAGCFNSVVHYVSGGLDSSIVLACLRDAPSNPRIVCVTQWSPGADGDERPYARLAVERAGCQLHVEQRRNADVKLDGLLHASALHNPHVSMYRIETAQTEADLASKFDVDAFFSGSGGDQLFLQCETQVAVSDFIRVHGVVRPLGSIAYRTAQLEGQSIWRVLGRGVLDAAVAGRYDPIESQAVTAKLVSARTLEIARHRDSPWARWRKSADRAPPGKQLHALMLSIPDEYYDSLGDIRDPPQIAPLLSQPAIELALRIPTYVLVDGQDRGLARRAFSSDLPIEIVKRTGKGGIEQHSLELIRNNLPFIRDLLLNGLLVQSGLLAKEKLSEALADQPSGVMKGTAELCTHLGTEAWLRACTNEPTTLGCVNL